MTDHQPNEDEGSNPDADLKAQNPGETTTADLTAPDDKNKTQKLTTDHLDGDTGEAFE